MCENFQLSHTFKSAVWLLNCQGQFNLHITGMTAENGDVNLHRFYFCELHFHPQFET